ncbi:MAG: FAD-dependent oxidoreductase [Eubacteriales bacterium]|nr:FAD-dependent oxidoreductase [Eubacteriales bacterium]MDD3883022.1 FAD-dependent oxidoreductase [Eubacteriales bacterium]MDD4513651.1 FAD-dependent oxidoreductase [Eubacteriales bacterium]
MRDVIIIGGGTAGLTAALYLTRAGVKPLLVEAGGFGGQITSSPMVENYPGISSISGMEFADRLMQQAADSGTDMELADAGAISRNGEKLSVLIDGVDTECRAVIIAVGAKHRELQLPRERELCGRGVSYCAVCDGAFYKGQPTAVVGGGSSALQSALYLSQISSAVTLIHRREELRGDKLLYERLGKQKNVSFLLGAQVQELIGDNELSGVSVRDNKGNTYNVAVNGLFVCVGQTPNTAPFAGAVALDESGYVLAGEDCKTSMEGVFAAGDCRRKAVRQLTTAASDGATAAMGALNVLNA